MNRMRPVDLTFSFSKARTPLEERLKGNVEKSAKALQSLDNVAGVDLNTNVGEVEIQERSYATKLHSTLIFNAKTGESVDFQEKETDTWTGRQIRRSITQEPEGNTIYGYRTLDA